jgi:hypothetical protein
MPATKQPSRKQLAARRKFALAAKARSKAARLKKKVAATKKKNPSPAQLRARKKFAAAAKKRARLARVTKRRNGLVSKTVKTVKKVFSRKGKRNGGEYVVTAYYKSGQYEIPKQKGSYSSVTEAKEAANALLAAGGYSASGAPLNRVSVSIGYQGRELYSKKKNPTHLKRKASAKKRPRRKNDGLADKLETFRGRPQEGILNATAPSDAPEDLYTLGILVALETEDETFEFEEKENVILAADDNNNLYILNAPRQNPGGDNLGDLVAVSYVVEKDHLGGGVVEWTHEFGEEGGERPTLIVDHDGVFGIVGGDYTITSAGIEN